ncbi:Uncharacterised protein [Mycobacteroides abscessus subsp. abscessus]|nr:Uncharacterised protein [Mycobacteroides abscessus subsp. abscessus]
MMQPMNNALPSAPIRGLPRGIRKATRYAPNVRPHVSPDSGEAAREVMPTSNAIGTNASAGPGRSGPGVGVVSSRAPTSAAAKTTRVLGSNTESGESITTSATPVDHRSRKLHLAGHVASPPARVLPVVRLGIARPPPYRRSART